MRVVFRVDASLQIGAGHVMRCLTLARVLKENGANVEFICRKHEGNLINKIRSNGFNVFELELLAENKVDNKLFYSHWLDSTQQQDAKDCLSVLHSDKVNLLIVDHYGIDENWQQYLQSYYDKLLVIDDLADRKHQCDILLDQTFGRQQGDYKDLVPASCELLLGSQFSLLRPEFAKWRQYSLERRSNLECKQLLVNMGGVDADNVTELVLEKLETCHMLNNIEIIVVMGETAPHLESVRARANALSYKTVVKVNVRNMAEIMANADIAIGAAGSTTWERCCLGLPTIQIVVADNQIDIARNLASINAIKLINNLNHLSENIEDMVQFIDKISLVSSSIVDGKGVIRLRSFIDSKESYTDLFLIRPVDLRDSDFAYSLQTKEVRKYFVNTEVPSIDQHIDWFQKIIDSPTSQLFILMLGVHKTGILRVDNINSDKLEVSIIVSPDYWGNRLANKALNIIESLVLNKTLKAVIHNNNTASKKVFLRSGFIMNKKDGQFSEYLKFC
jgi:UDP-2,4-diacetamido-2,4,6-trideoxy-beta-L-altropyranose hydrolase